MDIFGHKFNDSFSTNETATWHSEPGFRGTYSLISTCIITLVLCVWSAVHMNVPQHGRPQWRERANWILSGIFIPEYVAVIAFRQSLEADKVCREMIEVLGSAMSWTKVHAFYVMMGGYAFDINPSDESFLPHSMTRVALTPEGLKYIISHEPDLLPDLTEEDINDKSKASGFAKALACAQATWFCLFCIARIAQGLSISLLEVNTIAHAICALFIYCLWWKKPFDVQQPTLIPVRGDRLRALVAYMWMSSGDSSRSGDGYRLPEFECLDYAPGSESCPLDIIVTTHVTVVPKAYVSQYSGGESDRIQQHTGFTLRPGSRRFWKRKPSRTKRQRQGLDDPGKILLPRSIQLDQSSLTRWQLASRAIREYGLPPPDKVDMNFLVAKPRTSPEYKSLNFNEGPFMIGLGLSLGIYGSVHALAWNYHFISPGEQLYWRASALILMSPAVYFPIIVGSLYIYQHTDEFWAYTRTVNSILKFALRLCFALAFLILFGSLGGGAGLLFIPYPAARFYVIILSIKDVFFLEPEVFQQPSWTRYVPHIV